MKYHPSGEPNLVYFVQFLFPDGSLCDQWVERDETIFKKSVELWGAGFRLEIENHQGTIWMSAVNHNLELCVDRFCQNGPHVLTCVDELVCEAHKKFIEKI